MSSAVKTCGLSRPEDIAVANELRPDCVGFVFWPKSRRYVTPEAATGLRALLSPDIKLTFQLSMPSYFEKYRLTLSKIIKHSQHKSNIICTDFR